MEKPSSLPLQKSKPILPIFNTIINIRENILRKFLGISSNEVLNLLDPQNPPMEPLQIVKMVKLAVNEFKEEAMNKTGSRVDYSRLCEAECYRRFQEELIPNLRTLDLNYLGTREEAIAFWINIYNALVIHAVIKYEIKESVAEGGFRNMIRFFRRAAYDIGGLRFSLEDIEHGILRSNRGNPYQFSPQFTGNDPRQSFVIHALDPRIHFALNCASQSCPPIGVYTPENLNIQLDMAASNFIQHEVQIKGNQLWLSQIFNWYSRDFGKKNGLVRLLLKYLPHDERYTLLNEQGKHTKFKYLPYDWDLNT